MKLETKSVFELLKYHFNIPNFQRGFRWEEQNVTDLLEDLQEYRELYLKYREAKLKNDNDTNHNECSEFYCLQPIVVKRNDRLSKDKGYTIYDVIDGQQRLTTLFLILATYAQEDARDIFEDKPMELFSLSFDRGLEDYLKNKQYVTDKTLCMTNINAFFIQKAYETIITWSTKTQNSHRKVVRALLGDEETLDKFITKVIWYDLSDSPESSIEVFTRLNKGKIGLTDAELIKALLFECDKYVNQESRKKDVIKMASEWEYMEKCLHNDYFWGFIAPEDYNPSSRISLVLHKVARGLNRDIAEIKEKSFSEQKDKFDYHVIDAFLKIRSKANANQEDAANKVFPVDELWSKIQEAFSVLQNWYKDREVYHLIGYLTIFSQSGHGLIDDLFDEYQKKNKTKTDFKKYLRQKVSEIISFATPLDKLLYGKHNSELYKILLLLNIHTMITNNKENALYPFKKQRDLGIKSLEHIHPQNLDDDIDESPKCFEEKVKPWTSNKLLLLQTTQGQDGKLLISQLASEDKELLEKLVEQGVVYYQSHFQAIKEMIGHVDRIFRDFIELEVEEMHSIRNLALISKEDNSALQNGFLDEKKAKIKELCSNSGKYIPLCTRMVFDKEFSRSVNMRFWDKEDRDGYYAEIKRVYDFYMTQKTSAQ